MRLLHRLLRPLLRRGLYAAFTGVACLLISASVVAQDDLLARAKGLLERGEADAAYELLVPYQSERAGNPDYDFVLGIAALDSGRPTEAVFAFERVLAVNPTYTQARAELARAYFELNETERAKREFTAAQEQGPPPEAQATIQRYLDAIQRAETGERTTVQGYASLTLGYDTNVNSATDDSQIAIPLFGGALATLDDSGVEQDDVFVRPAVGISVNHALTPEFSLLAGGNFYYNRNNTERQFDTGSANANVGLSYERARDTYTLALQGDHFRVNRNAYRDAYGAILQWSRIVNPRTQVSAYAQGTRLDYSDQPIRDADRYVFGAAVSRALTGEGSPIVYAGGYFGEEDERNSGVPQLGHNLFGFRFGGQVEVTPKALIYASARFEKRNYGGDDPFFLVSRRDKRYDGTVGVRYEPARKWSISPQLSHIRSSSNVPINDYDRTVVSVTLRRDLY